MSLKLLDTMANDLTRYRIMLRFDRRLDSRASLGTTCPAAVSRAMRLHWAILTNFVAASRRENSLGWLDQCSGDVVMFFTFEQLGHGRTTEALAHISFSSRRQENGSKTDSSSRPSEVVTATEIENRTLPLRATGFEMTSASLTATLMRREIPSRLTSCASRARLIEQAGKEAACVRSLFPNGGFLGGQRLQTAVRTQVWPLTDSR